MGLPSDDADANEASGNAWTSVKPVQNGHDPDPGSPRPISQDLEDSVVQILQIPIAEEKKIPWIHTAQADLFFGGWIVVNALTLALETDLRTASNEKNAIWMVMDSTFNVVFTIEMVIRMATDRSRWPRDLWNLFDFVLVTVGIFDSWVMPALGGDSDVRFVTLMRLFRLLRLIRVLRVLRLLRFLRELMLLIAGITSAMKAMVWGLMLLAITIFICSLLVTRVVGKECCDAEDRFSTESYKDYFGTLPRSAFTLFQFTMEFQPDICRETWDDGPWLTLFFLAYTMFTNVTLLNTVASVIVENILSISNANREIEKEIEDQTEQRQRDSVIAAIFDQVDQDGNRSIDYQELARGDKALKDILAMSGVTQKQAMDVFNVMDVDKSGSVSRDEFRAALGKLNRAPEATDILRLECQLYSLDRKLDVSLREMSQQNKDILDALGQLQEAQRSGPLPPQPPGPPPPRPRMESGGISNGIPLSPAATAISSATGATGNLGNSWVADSNFWPSMPLAVADEEAIFI